jgi:hypothetical protein
MTPIARPPHRFASRLARSSEADDRRLFRRFTATGLMVRVGDQFVEIADISVGGMRVARQDLAKGAELRVQLLPRDGTKLALNHAIPADVVVVGSCADWTHFRFTTVTYSLAKLIVRHIAMTTGTEPYHFR